MERNQRRREQKEREIQRFTKRGQIIGLHRNGYSKKAIAEILGINIKTVNRWVKRYDEEGIGKRKASGAPPKVTTPEMDQRIVNLSIENPHKSSGQIRAELGLGVSNDTVRMRLHAAGRHGHSYAVKPFLSQQ